MTEADAFFAPTGSPRSGGPEREPDVVNGRYVLTDPATKTVRSWTRASNIGVALADQFGLNKYRMRKLLTGLSLRPDLLDLLKVMVEPDNAKLDEVISTALEVAGTTESANRGTTIHEVQRRVHLGLDIPEDMRHFADAYTAALAKNGLTVVTTEVRVLNPGLGAAGRTDVILREADGTLVIGDTKSTDHINLAAPEFAPQLAVYATAEWIEMGGDGGQWTRMPEIRKDYAICIHVSRETGAVAIYRVDMRLGAYAANLATQVREWRTTKGVLLPYVPPAPVNPAAVTVTYAPAVRPFDQPDPMDATVHPDEHSEQASNEAARAFPTAGNEGTGQQYPNAGLDQPVSTNTVDTNVTTLPGTPGDPPLRTTAELTKMSKAAVQQYMRDHGMPDDLAHTKAILIARAASKGKTADQDVVSTADMAGRAHRKPEHALPPADANGGVAPVDIPGTPEFIGNVIHRIETAATVGQIGQLQQWVVRQGGDQAWTDDMTERARTKANELDTPPSPTALDRVKACQSQEDLAKLWTALTIGGSRPEGWPPEIDAAARARLAEIQAAATAAPANPFGN